MNHNLVPVDIGKPSPITITTTERRPNNWHSALSGRAPKNRTRLNFENFLIILRSLLNNTYRLFILRGIMNHGHEPQAERTTHVGNMDNHIVVALFSSLNFTS